LAISSPGWLPEWEEALNFDRYSRRTHSEMLAKTPRHKNGKRAANRVTKTLNAHVELP
jgi:hypothetical protein